MRALLALVVACAAGIAQAQQWPSKPLRIIVPFTPGGFNDTLGRTLAAELPKTLGQPVIVENKPGGNTIIGTGEAAKAPPDGYTLFVAALPFSVIQSLYKTPFDVTRDFAPITLAGTSANMLVANPAFPANSVQELIKLAKQKPGGINYATSGNGTSVHLSMEMFKTMTGTFITHIPYRGSAPAVTDLLGGQVDIMFDNTPNVLPHVRAGKMKALGISTKVRSPLAPEVPTINEAGVPGYDVAVWFGILTSAGTPKDIVARLNRDIGAILNSPAVSERFAKQGVDVQTTTPEQFGEFVKAEVVRWAGVIREAGIKAD